MMVATPGLDPGEERPGAKPPDKPGAPLAGDLSHTRVQHSSTSNKETRNSLNDTDARPPRQTGRVQHNPQFGDNNHQQLRPWNPGYNYLTVIAADYWETVGAALGPNPLWVDVVESGRLRQTFFSAHKGPKGRIIILQEWAGAPAHLLDIHPYARIGDYDPWNARKARTKSLVTTTIMGSALAWMLQDSCVPTFQLAVGVTFSYLFASLSYVRCRWLYYKFCTSPLLEQTGIPNIDQETLANASLADPKPTTVGQLKTGPLSRRHPESADSGVAAKIRRQTVRNAKTPLAQSSFDVGKGETKRQILTLPPNLASVTESGKNEPSLDLDRDSTIESMDRKSAIGIIPTADHPEVTGVADHTSKSPHARAHTSWADMCDSSSSEGEGTAEDDAKATRTPVRYKYKVLKDSENPEKIEYWYFGRTSLAIRDHVKGIFYAREYRQEKLDFWSKICHAKKINPQGEYRGKLPDFIAISQFKKGWDGERKRIKKQHDDLLRKYEYQVNHTS